MITVLGQSFNVPAAWPIALETTVTDDCGNAIGAGNVFVVSFSNGDPPLSLQSSGPGGVWSGTWVSGNTSGPVTVTVTANNPNGSLTGTRIVTGGLGDLSPAPVVTAAVNSATFVQKSYAGAGLFHFAGRDESFKRQCLSRLDSAGNHAGGRYRGDGELRASARLRVSD